MGYTLENLCENHYLVRLGDNHHKFGDPYTATVVMVMENDTVHFKGAVGKLNNVKYLFNVLKSWGYNTIVWERYRSDGTIKYIEVEI